MSLNGLDDVKVKEAHDAAIAELGGWFLLKYVSRDEVDLFERGNGGIVEIRNAIAQFEEESPLFGFLRYRRRNVLVKYVPEGCSRLVQARVIVHFNAFSEKFTPHDTIFPITSSKDLKDSSLSAACSLHTASGSTSSSTSSLRKRRLMEIAEDENEDKRQSLLAEDHPSTMIEASIADMQTQTSAAKFTMRSPDLASSASQRSRISDAAALSSSGLTPLSSDNRPTSPSKSLDGRRQSSQSTRPDIYSYNSFGSNGRPKVKLGPRPSLDMGGRPQTSASLTSYRPVSTLPPGLKLFPKSSKVAKEGMQLHNPSPPPTMTVSPPPLPGDNPSAQQATILTRPHTSGGRPKTASGSSIKSSMSPSPATPKSPIMTPEKMRLMKAMQLRKKKMSSPSNDGLEPPPVPEIRLPEDMSTEEEKTVGAISEMERADSAIAIEALPVLKVANLDTIMTNSTPETPTEPSEGADSTQASSLSESTDETVREAHEDKRLREVEGSGTTKVKNEESNQDRLIMNHITSAESETIEDAKTQSIEPMTTDLDNKNSQGIEVDLLSENKSEIERTLPEGNGEPGPSLDHHEEVPSLGRNILASGVIIVKTDKLVETQVATANSAPGIMRPGPVIHKVQDVSEQRPLIMESIETDQSPTSPIRQLKIPRSKFSAQPLEVYEVQNSVQAPAPVLLPPPVEQLPEIDVPKSPTGSRASSESKRSFPEEEHDAQLLRHGRKKRRGLVEPIRTDLSAERSGHNSEAELLSDDDLMDELQSATVQEAQPISVSKSPISPTFPTENNRYSRAFSNPFASRSKMLSPHDPLPEKARSTSSSAIFINRKNQQQTLPVIKKVNLGSGISQRIKALEKLSNSTSSPAQAAGTTAGSSPAFFMVRQPSRAGSKSPSIVERSESLTKSRESPMVSREGSPETLKFRERSESMKSRFEALNSTTTMQSQRSRPESISVTARIIRDPNQPFPQKPDLAKDAFEMSPLDLHQSPLVIDHQKAFTAPPSPQKETLLERRLSNPRKDGTKDRRSSISMVKDLINDRRSSNAERRKSMTIEPPTPSTARSSSRPPSTHANSPSVGRPLSVSSRVSSSSRDQSTPLSQSVSSPANSDDNADKKSGRTSRMLRKMSATLSASRKSLAHAISPTVREELEPPQITPTQFSQHPNLPTIEVGDVNVQFPDTLLWKRRSMSLNSQGYLVLSPAQGNKGMEKSTSIKSYHLSEFRMPFIPEMELQELPNSVVLDFVDGGGLQVACEDRGGQKRVLQILVEAHRSHSAFGQ